MADKIQIPSESPIKDLPTPDPAAQVADNGREVVIDPAVREQQTLDNAESGTKSDATPLPDALKEQFAKFDSVEAMAQSYAELEKKHSAPNTPEPAPEKEPAKLGDLDLDALTQEFTENGGLTDETTKKLVDSGVPQQFLDTYLQGLEAIGSQFSSSVVSVAGGREAYDKLVEWARASLPAEDQQAFNSAVTSNSLETAELAVRGLMSKRAEAVGEPNLITGGNHAVADAPPFESTAQVTEAMSDKRYQTDPAFRAKVEKRLANSKLW